MQWSWKLQQDWLTAEMQVHHLYNKIWTARCNRSASNRLTMRRVYTSIWKPNSCASTCAIAKGLCTNSSCPAFTSCVTTRPLPLPATPPTIMSHLHLQHVLVAQPICKQCDGMHAYGMMTCRHPSTRSASMTRDSWGFHEAFTS